MNGAFYIGATALRSQQSALDVVANNIANLNTPAYKRSEVRFAELVSLRARAAEQLALEPRVTPADTATSAGVAMNGSSRVFGQGDLRQTGNALDLAISGKGFIELMGPSGETLLWRGGSLKVDAEGFLAAANGLQLKSMISVPTGATEVTIARDGAVTAVAEGEAAPTEIGQIDIVMAKDEAALTALDGGLFGAAAEDQLMTTPAGTEGAGVFVQGSIEGSNVQLSEEMVTLLLMQRAYGASAQVVQAADQLMSIANSLRR